MMVYFVVRLIQSTYSRTASSIHSTRWWSRTSKTFPEALSNSFKVSSIPDISVQKYIQCPLETPDVQAHPSCSPTTSTILDLPKTELLVAHECKDESVFVPGSVGRPVQLIGLGYHSPIKLVRPVSR